MYDYVWAPSRAKGLFMWPKAIIPPQELERGVHTAVNF